MVEKILLIAHGDLDGLISAALELEKISGKKMQTINETMSRLDIKFTQPFRIEKLEIPSDTKEIYCVDIAIDSKNPEKTRDFIRNISKPLVRWIDHHRGWSIILAGMPEEIKKKFVIDENASACALLINASNKLTKDAIAADTREQELTKRGKLLDQALKSNPADNKIKIAIIKYLLGDRRYQFFLENAASRYRAVQLPNTSELLKNNREIKDGIVIVDARNSKGPYDRTLLSILAQELSPQKTAIILVRNQQGDKMIIATKTGIDLPSAFNVLGGHQNIIEIQFYSRWAVNKAIRRLKKALSKNNL